MFHWFASALMNWLNRAFTRGVSAARAAAASACALLGTVSLSISALVCVQLPAGMASPRKSSFQCAHSCALDAAVLCQLGPAPPPAVS